MTSPYPLPITVETYYDAAWHDITPDVRQTQDIVMSWGTANEAPVAAPSTMTMILNNGRSKVNPSVFGRYSLHNPRSDLFGKISRNTPVRVRLGDVDRGLSLTGVTGCYAYVEDTAVLDITGDIDMRIDIAPETWRPSDVVVLAAKYDGTGQWSWIFYLSTDGTLRLTWTTDGFFGTRVTVTSTAAIPEATERLSVRVTLDVNNGASGNTTTFYTGPSVGGAWTQLGAPVVTSGVTSLFSGAADLTLGAGTAGDGIFSNGVTFSGKMYAFQLRNGVLGTIVANPDFAAQDPGVSNAPFTDGAGRSWVLSNLAHIEDSSVRMVGEITQLPTEWDVSGRDVWIPLEAKGISRRLGQGKSALRSALFRDLSTVPNVVAYWPMEDGRDATSVAEARGGKPLVLSGDVTMAGYDGFAGSDSVPTFGNIAHLTGIVPGYVPNARQRVACMLHQSSTQPADRNLLFMSCRGGTVADATLVLKADGSLRIVLRNFVGTSLLDFSGSLGDLRDRNAMVWMLLTQVGSNIEWQIGKVFEGDTGLNFHSGTVNNQSYGRFTSMRVGAAGDLGGTAIGHVHIVNGDDSEGLWNTIFTSLVGWIGETSGNRVIRLHRESGIPLVFIGDPDRTEAMGKQGSKTLSSLLKECADADLGILDDHPRVRARRFRTRESLYDQAVALTLDYSAGEVAPPLRPVPDDQSIRNDITVTRDGGSSARSIQDTGPLNIKDPADDPQGVGRYDAEVPLVLADDAQLADQAGWRKRLGTVDEDRYPMIKVNLGRDPHLSDAARSLSTGDRLQIIKPPDMLPAKIIDQLAQGGKERLSTFKHEVEFVCIPASPWSVAYVSDGTDEQRADTDGSETGADFTAGTDTSMSVAVTQGPLWTTDVAQMPLRIEVSGVVLEVTAISGASSPQIFTITQTPVNGVEKIISSGSPIRLAEDPPIGL